MVDKTVNLGCVLAWLLWGVVVALTLTSVAERDVYVVTLAGVIGLAAGTVTIRCFFVAQNQMMRSAFELGQDAGRMECRPEASRMYPVR